MDKQAIINRLKSSRSFNTVDYTPEWNEAFEAYNQATGSKLRARDKCSKCFSAVKEWLLKDE